MAFTVTYTDLPTDEYGDDDTYEVLQSGVLKVSSSGKTHYSVPDVWKKVVADSDHDLDIRKAPVPRYLDSGFREGCPSPTPPRGV
jgi:hypothetical protein